MEDFNIGDFKAFLSMVEKEKKGLTVPRSTINVIKKNINIVLLDPPSEIKKIKFDWVLDNLIFAEETWEYVRFSLKNAKP